LGCFALKNGIQIARPKYHVTTACDINLGTQTSNPIWRKERNRRQEEGDGDTALLASLTVEVVKNTRKKGFRMHWFPTDPVVRVKWVKFVRKHRPDFKGQINQNFDIFLSIQVTCFVLIWYQINIF